MSKHDAILDALVARFPELAVCRADIRAAFDAIRDSYRAGGKLLLCGNGGSNADCEHIAGELMKGFLLPRRGDSPARDALRELGANELADQLQDGLPAIPLNLCGLNSAVANDLDGALVYAQSVFALGRPGDVLLGISTSGNAQNVLNAALAAKSQRMRTVALTGESGGKMLRAFDTTIRVPARETYRVQEYHLPVYHALCAMLESAFFG